MSGGEKEAPIAECPRCGEEDYRFVGPNQCGLCECRFTVDENGKAWFLKRYRKSRP